MKKNKDYMFQTKIDSRTDFEKEFIIKHVKERMLLQWKKSCNIIKCFMKV